MIFNASATYALRALSLLAADPEQAVLGRDLAKDVDVPSHYLSKILATLARAGVLTASRGSRGGYRLARPAEEIRLVEVVEPFEGKRVRPGCLLQPDQPCSEDGACSAHSSWASAKAAYVNFLESTTLADIRRGGQPCGIDRSKQRRRRRA